MRKCNQNILVIASALFLTTACNSADDRLRTYFDIPTSAILNESTIRNAILLKIPINTPESVVRQKLSEIGIGKDKLSGYFGSDKDRKAVISIGLDSHSYKIVHRHYGVHLTYDDEMKLHDVVISMWLTGP